MERRPVPAGEEINGRLWYRYLVPQTERRSYLYETLTDQDIRDGLIVCFQLEEGNRFYSFFENYSYYFSYYNQIPDDYRCFYEVIIGSQKPHYDIDIAEDQLKPGEDLETVGTYLVSRLRERIVKQLALMGVTDGYEILEFQSHGVSKGVRKFSKHIIVNGVAHTDERNAKAFFKKTAMGVRYNTYIDHSVYKKNQQFRLPGCHKFGDHRIKCPDNHDFPEDLQEQCYYLATTLVGYTEDCRILPNLIKELDRSLVRDDPIHDLPEEIIQEGLERLAQYYDGKLPYTRGKIHGGTLRLNHIRGMKIVCPLCPHTQIKPHENDHAMLKYRNGELWFHCWRNDTQNLSLGLVSGPAKAVIVEIEEKQEKTAGILQMGRRQINLNTKEVTVLERLKDEEDEPDFKSFSLEEEADQEWPSTPLPKESSPKESPTTPKPRVRPTAQIFALTQQCISEKHVTDAIKQEKRAIDKQREHDQKRIAQMQTRTRGGTPNSDSGIRSAGPRIRKVN